MNVHEFVYIKTCIVHDTSSSKTTGTFVVNIAEISLTFSFFLSLSFSSLCNIFVECYVAYWKRERSRKNEKKKRKEKKKEIEGNKISFLLTCVCIKVIVSAGTSEILGWIVYFCLKRNKEKNIKETKKCVECQSKL